MKRGHLTESVRGRVEPEVKSAMDKLTEATDRSEGHHLRAALRAYAPLRPYLEKGKR